MPPAKRKLVVLPQSTANKKPRPATSKPKTRARLTVATNPFPPTRSGVKRWPIAPSEKFTSSSALSAALSIPISNQRFDKGHYPWDDYQDDIVVRSVELDDYGDDELTGVQHYRHILEGSKREYEHVCFDFDEYRLNGKNAAFFFHTEELEVEDEGEEEAMVANGSGYAELPQQVDDYDNPIYTAKTTNPAVILAITRIAQRNLKFLDFTSALDHLPNLPPNRPLPKLQKDVFSDNHPHHHRNDDVQVTIAFLPAFHQDGAHAIGYFTLPHSQKAHTHPSFRLQTEGCLFTPCSTADLEDFSLVLWNRKKIRGKARGIQAVGSRNGAWVKKDDGSVETNEWDVCKTVAGEVWGKRVGAFGGKG